MSLSAITPSRNGRGPAPATNIRTPRVRRSCLRSRQRCRSAQQAELQREAFVNRLLRRRLAGLVIDDCDAAVGKAVDAVDAALDDHTGDRRLAADLRLQRSRPVAWFVCSSLRSSRSLPAAAAPTAPAASGGSPRPASSASAPAASFAGSQSSCSASPRTPRGQHCPSSARCGRHRRVARRAAGSPAHRRRRDRPSADRQR